MYLVLLNQGPHNKNFHKRGITPFDIFRSIKNQCNKLKIESIWSYYSCIVIDQSIVVENLIYCMKIQHKSIVCINHIHYSCRWAQESCVFSVETFCQAPSWHSLTIKLCHVCLQYVQLEIQVFIIIMNIWI